MLTIRAHPKWQCIKRLKNRRSAMMSPPLKHYIQYYFNRGLEQAYRPADKLQATARQLDPLVRLFVGQP